MDENLLRWRYFWQIFNESYLRWKKWNIHKIARYVFYGGRESLQVELNILGDNCGGCQFHEFPYTAKLPLLINGKREVRSFTCKEDIWNVLDLLIEEVHESNEKGKEFDVAQSINAQLPFFTCKNFILDRSIQKDIQRYLYCNETSVPPYSGAYDDQPAIWMGRYFIIKKAFAKKDKIMINKSKKENK